MTAYSLNTYSLLCATVLLFACGQAPQNAPGGGLPISYTDPHGVFKIRHPDGWVAQQYHLITETYEADGTAFLAPIDQTKNTLYEGMVHVANMPACPDQIHATNIQIQETLFQHSIWDSAAAGNRYEGETFTAQKNSDCIVVTFFAHSCNLAPADCAPTHPEPYDRAALFGTMDQMLETLQLL